MRTWRFVSGYAGVFINLVILMLISDYSTPLGTAFYVLGTVTILALQIGGLIYDSASLVLSPDYKYSRMSAIVSGLIQWVFALIYIIKKLYTVAGIVVKNPPSVMDYIFKKEE